MSGKIKQSVDGIKFNMLTIIRRTKIVNRQHFVLCKCDCGNEKEICLYSIKSGNTKSCGCIREDRYNKITDRVGNRYDRLVVIEDFKKVVNGARFAYCRCICDCGNIVERPSCSLQNKNGNISCGCARKDNGFKHGHTRGGKTTSEYSTYINIIQRCYSENSISYKNYGARGIAVCKEWLGDEGFINFFRDMGKKPFKKATLERDNNEIGYSKSNCRWATYTEQARNTRKNVVVSIDGISKCLSQWCEEFNFPYTTVRERIRKGIHGNDIFKLKNKNHE